jgi:hypothetical protein
VYSDEDGYVARVAGKVYVLDGNDAEKLAVLRGLAATDFLSAEWMPIPESFGVISPNGERLGLAQLSQLADEYTKSVLVGPMLERLAESLPQQLRQRGDEFEPFMMKMPEAPLTVLTVVVERPDGQLVPMVNTH